MKTYPKIIPSDSKDVFEMLRYINKERPNDINDFDNLFSRFVNGHSENTGSVTLAVSASSTVVSNGFIRAGSTPILTPMTANAALEATSGDLFVSAVADGSFTIHHTNGLSADRTFRYAVFGL